MLDKFYNIKKSSSNSQLANIKKEAKSLVTYPVIFKLCN